MSTNRRLAALAVVVLAAGGLGTVCCQKNRPPVVESISGPIEVLASDTVHLTCNASDPDGDSLVYVWDCTKGQLAFGGAQASWAAPGTTSTATVMVTVADEEDLEDYGHKTISVVGMTILWDEIHWSWMGQGSYSHWKGMTEGTKIRVLFHVKQDSLERTVSFAIMDSVNHSKWLNGDEYTSLLKLPHTKGDTLSCAVPSAGTYYLCWNNGDEPNPGREFWATLLLSSPDSTVGRPLP